MDPGRPCHGKYFAAYEIHVCKDAPPPNKPSTHQRLRFALLASSAFPRPLGLLLWSLLNVALLLCAALRVVLAVSYFLVFVLPCLALAVALLYMFFAGWALGAVATDAVLLLIRFVSWCWSKLVCEKLRFRAGYERVVVSAGGGGSWPATMRFWTCFKEVMSGWSCTSVIEFCSFLWAKFLLACSEILVLHDAIVVG